MCGNTSSTFIVQPEISDEGVKTLCERLDGIAREARARSGCCYDDLGRRRLAYEIRNFQKGHYILLTFLDGGKVVPEVERVAAPRRLGAALPHRPGQGRRRSTSRRARPRPSSSSSLRAQRAAERAAREAEEAARLAAEAEAGELGRAAADDDDDADDEPDALLADPDVDDDDVKEDVR